MSNHPTRRSTALFFVCSGFLVGIFLLLVIRFVNDRPPEDIHYHANFAVYVNGQREMFADPLLYEEIASCEAEGAHTTRGRVHLHEQINDVVHVEDAAVTWGHFFQSIGWNIGDRYLDTVSSLLVENNAQQLHFILNGKPVSSIAGTIIGDRDRLLVSYGDLSEDQLQQQYETVASTAQHYDETKDPAACSGEHETGVWDRIRRLF